jgi:hypothetical protein
MTTHIYHKSEISQLPSTQSPLNRIKELFASAFEILFDLLIAEPNTEPRITELQGRDGEVFWEIQDARTGTTVYCMTEFEVMEWLDTRHYRQ